MDDLSPVSITLPLAYMRTLHGLAFKAPTTGAESAFALVAFHEQIMKATAPTPAPTPAPVPPPAEGTPAPAPVAENQA